MLKRVAKRSLYTFVALVASLLFYIAFEFVASSIKMPYALDDDASYEIFIKSNGVHTDLVLPIRSDLINWSELFLFENTLSKRDDYSYIAIGWGDRGFYIDTPRWRDLKVSTALVAASGVGSTLLHTTFYDEILEDDLTYSVMITAHQYRIIIDEIKNALSGGLATLVATNAQYGDSDAFYEAKGSYSIFFTCNSWTNRVLKRANLPASWWVASQRGILANYKSLREKD
ncbi:MAG: TIGR02117 family protein [Sulfuricurvum sp.]